MARVASPDPPGSFAANVATVAILLDAGMARARAAGRLVWRAQQIMGAVIGAR